jgi:hypothetical protein
LAREVLIDGDIARVMLPNSEPAIIDAADAHLAEGQPWRLNRSGYVAYCRHTPWVNGKRTSGWIFLHRVIAGTPDGLTTDHADGDTLNNRRANLRIVTNSQNAKNKRTRGRAKTSRYKGVNWYAARGQWTARVTSDYRGYHLGYFDSEEQAARAYDEAAKRHHGEYAALNFVE